MAKNTTVQALALLAAVFTKSCHAQNAKGILDDISGNTSADKSSVDSGGYRFLGCFADSVQDRVISNALQAPDGVQMTLEVCAGLCQNAHGSYFGVELGRECFCSDSINPDAQLANPVNGAMCNQACDGDDTELCGGSDAIDVYSNDPAQTYPGGGGTSTIYTSSTSSSSSSWPSSASSSTTLITTPSSSSISSSSPATSTATGGRRPGPPPSYSPSTVRTRTRSSSMRTARSRASMTTATMHRGGGGARGGRGDAGHTAYSYFTSHGSLCVRRTVLVDRRGAPVTTLPVPPYPSAYSNHQASAYNGTAL